MRQRERETRRGATAGFTLVELLVVIVIIGIIIALVLVASADGVRRAQERATQSLITKLNEGFNDRLDALMNITAPINPTHRYLAAICANGTPVTALKTKAVNSTDRRAQVIAQMDYIRGELPDVFFANASTSNGATIALDYPINCAGRAYATPAAYAVNATYDQYLLPLGNSSPGMPYWYVDPNTSIYQLTPNPLPPPPFSNATQLPSGAPYVTGIYSPPHSGIFGASFSALGGITKNLGYSPQGYDGIDNNSNGMIDEMSEAVPAGSTLDTLRTQVATQLGNHTHNTARAEMLYAILVEGIGPLGSVFNRDEFTAKEVQDTDGDGLPEFVDAWGQPLQFFRWPIYFGTVAGSSDSQRGSNPYDSFGTVRELDPLDPNQLLVSPGWWSNNGTLNAGLPVNSSGVSQTPFAVPNGTNISQGAYVFMNYFHSLVDPTPDDPRSPTGIGWDRSGQYIRRSYFSKALILSGGPDLEPGVGQFGRKYSGLTSDGTGNSADFPLSLPNTTANPPSMDQIASNLIFIENQASQSDPYQRGGLFNEVPNDLSTTPTSTTTFLRTNAGLDDISNHNIAAPGTGVR